MLTTFGCFPYLPPEIRLLIWEHIAALPQDIRLSCTTPNAVASQPCWYTSNRAPAIFAVNWEARAVALSVYTFLRFSKDQIGIPWMRPVYINLRSDVLCLGIGLQVRYAKSLLEDNDQLREGVTRLVVERMLWEKMNWVPPPAMLLPTPFASDTMERPFRTLQERLVSLEEVRFYEELQDGDLAIT
ncbi:hypothetical protein BP6252_08510 [Coleophoma cylindrospora]|uniref:2EXR domain-containing protein n=1 Tax=Coleophoma cylindrospora TaxID=1849047 RepID=A0A3D8R6B5_9HELO|nr:hypothetical protein BP6252_08510 [Coleophoma cylindrospora]